MNFTDDQQNEHREAFIKECRQNAWGAACHADFISKQLDDLMKEYAKLKEEDDTAAADIKELENAVDYHTVENREKRKALQEKRNQLAKVMQALGQNMGQGQKVLENLLTSMESNSALAEHAEGWEWKQPSSDHLEAIGEQTASPTTVPIRP